MRKALAALAVCVMAGCANTDGMAPTVSIAGYDQARVVNISPHGLACDELPCLALGVEWSSAKPESAVLIVKRVGIDYAGINRLSLKVDGKETTLAARASGTEFAAGSPPMRESIQTFAAPMQLVRDLASGRQVLARVDSVRGYLDGAIMDGEKDSKAVHALRRFLLAVDQGGPK
jgi:hypothetical protein